MNDRRPGRIASVLLVAGLAGAHARAGQRPEPNPAIDMDAHIRLTVEAARVRETHRVTEAEFLRMSREAGTVVLDARSSAKYDELHVRGAINLSFPDITVASLAAAIPDKSTRILIYCNNNFANAEGPFPSKLPSASLNLSTYIALYNYGYRNLYELGPLVDPKTCRLEFESAR
jgi:phage shock protein E